jgi:hypothetical protein
MDFVLMPIEARILGCLFEKSVTTPDYYPMTLNALTTACNQKSNREPVMDLSSEEVMRGIDSLRDKRLVALVSTAGGRVPKYAQRIDNHYEFNAQEQGILCVLLLRGPQTAAEIRMHSSRLCVFTGVAETEQVLDELMHREGGPFVVRLPRQTGRRECRYMHLLCGDVDMATAPAAQAAADAGPPDSTSGIDELQQEVADLRTALQALRTDFEAFRAQFGE